MLIINKKQRLVKNKSEHVPEFSNARLKILWLKNQRNEAILLNVKSVSLQVKDIKQMRLSSSINLISLYARFESKLSCLDDEEYITFSKQKKSDKHTILSIINADWILLQTQIENMSVEEIEKIYFELEEKIFNLKAGVVDRCRSIDYYNSLKLLEYKRNCIGEYLSSRIGENKIKSKKQFEKIN